MSDFLRHLQEITSCRCRKCSAEDNLKHLQRIFEGYHDHVLLQGAERCPYPERSSRAASWGHGVLLAKEDIESVREAWRVGRAGALKRHVE